MSESSRIEWQRDYDAVLVGFILGLLVALVIGFGMRLFLSDHYQPVQVEDADSADPDQRESAQ